MLHWGEAGRSRGLKRLACLLALAGTVHCAVGNLPPPALEDFESAALAAGRVHILREGAPSGPASDVWFHGEADHRPGGEGQSLYFGYAFPPVEPEALGVRIVLDELDASPYDHVTFWVRGDPAAGFSTTLRVGFRRPDPRAAGLMEIGSHVVSGITDRWQLIVVPLNLMTGIREWTDLQDFFVVVEPERATAEHGAYYLDEVSLVRTRRAAPTIGDRVIPLRKRAWEESLGGKTAASPHIRERLRSWPRRLLATPHPATEEDRDFLARLAADTWRGLDALTDRENGLPLDHVVFTEDGVEPGLARFGDYANVTNVGLYLIAVVSAYELGLLTEDEAVDRVALALDTLDRLETYAGFFFNYYDTTSLERTSNFVSFVDSAWLTAGLMVVRMTFPALHERCTRFIDQGNYAFFYDSFKGQMHHGYYVNVPARSEHHYGVLYTEARIGSLIAIGKGDVPEEHWFQLVRTFSPLRVWQTMTPLGRATKTVRGHTFAGGYYQWQGVRYVPSWGGSMFEALMPILILDELTAAPKSLGANAVAHVEVQRRFAVDTLGYPVWGLSPSTRPAGDAYGEYGVRVLGSRGYDAGAVTPHASALALSVASQAAIANLRRLADRHAIYGEYGFYDALNPVSGQVAHSYLALDQAMILIATANHLKDGCVQGRFMADPIVQRVLPMLGDENFFD